MIMPREIKFRVWDNLKREWVQNKGIWRISTNENGIGGIVPPIWFKQHPQGHTIQQFTGLKDRNGAEIYEGDILRVETGLIQVIYSEDIAGFEGVGLPHKVSSRSLYGYNYPPKPDKIFSVIGNIFENPELMKS